MIVCLCKYCLFPGFVITGAPFTVIVNSAFTASFTPSSAVTVTG